MAVSENARAHGKRSGGSVRRVVAASIVLAGVGLGGAALAAPDAITFNADSGTGVDVSLGEAFQISGTANNVVTSTTATGVQIKLAQNINLGSAGSLKIGNSTLNNTGLTITGGPSIAASGINAGNKKVTQVSAGNVASGSTDAVNGGQLYNLQQDLNTHGVGVKYFHANSALADSRAVGKDSTAMGPNAIAGFDATSEAAIAVGRNASAQGKQTLAVGDGATVESQFVTGAQAIGQGAKVTGFTSNDAIAMGTGASAAPDDSISLGSGAGVGTPSDPGGNRHSQIAIGKGSGQNVNGNQTVAIGEEAGSNATFDSTVLSTGSVSIGAAAGSGLSGAYNVSMGYQANAGAGQVEHAVAIGGNTQAKKDASAIGYQVTAGDSAVALGTAATAASNGVAIGRGASAGARHIALGLNSAATDADSLGAGFLTGSAALANGVVSVGSTLGNVQRRIVNVADGSNAYDAINVRQLKGAQTSIANVIGGGMTVNPNGTYGTITLPKTGGGTVSFNTVADAIGALSSGVVNVRSPRVP